MRLWLVIYQLCTSKFTSHFRPEVDVFTDRDKAVERYTSLVRSNSKALGNPCTTHRDQILEMNSNGSLYVWLRPEIANDMLRDVSQAGADFHEEFERGVGSIEAQMRDRIAASESSTFEAVEDSHQDEIDDVNAGHPSRVESLQHGPGEALNHVLDKPSFVEDQTGSGYDRLTVKLRGEIVATIVKWDYVSDMEWEQKCATLRQQHTPTHPGFKR
jgi:hypothetical protein